MSEFFIPTTAGSQQYIRKLLVDKITFKDDLSYVIRFWGYDADKDGFYNLCEWRFIDENLFSREIIGLKTQL